jgi:hypothetical protein
MLFGSQGIPVTTVLLLETQRERHALKEPAPAARVRGYSLV